MRALTPVLIGLGTFDAAAIAQTAAAPIEPKAGSNAQSADQAGLANAADSSVASPRDPAPPANTAAPVEPKR